MKRVQVSNALRLLACPVCLSRLSLEASPDAGWPNKGTLVCPECSSEYRIKSYIPHLLPPHLEKAFNKLQSSLTAARKGHLRIGIPERQIARDWLLGVLSLTYPVRKAQGIQLWRDAAILLRIASDLDLSYDERCELLAMYAAFRMAPRYRARVADQLGASLHAALYERYEDILLRGLVEQALERPMVLIELGSGVGRVLHQYASCLKNEGTAAPYKLMFPQMYSGEKLRNLENLKLLLGLDFQERMFSYSNAWLRESKLSSMVTDARLMQVLGTVQHLPFALNGSVFGRATKVVCVLFQTIGNQLTPGLRSEMLRKAWNVVKPSGILLVSAFNGTAFNEQGVPYYADISASVGKPIYSSENTFLSSRGVYSKWMTPDELRETLEEAGIEKFRILTEAELPILHKYQEYLPIESQEFLRKRALVAVASSNRRLDIDRWLLAGLEE